MIDSWLHYDADKLKSDCYRQWKLAEKRMDPDAKKLKDLYCILVQKQIIILGMPIFHN